MVVESIAYLPGNRLFTRTMELEANQDLSASLARPSCIVFPGSEGLEA